MTRGFFLVLLLLLAAPAGAQVVPPAIQQELSQRNMSEAEARAMAQQLGINLNDPVQAAQRARELGVPESTIQEMLNAIKTQDDGAAATSVVGAVSIDPSSAVVPPPSASLGSTEAAQQASEVGQLRDIAEAESSSVVEEAAVSEDLEFFGYDIFDSIPDAFQPNAVGPVDDAYVIGPGDELRLTVWGAAEFGYELTVDAEGRIFVPRVGQFLASGTRLNALRVNLKRFLSRSYAGLETDPPTVFMDLTVSRIRPVQVYVLGEVSRPGGYTISANASGFNVLYATGGPLTRGSLRSIEILRNGRRIGGIDLYNYLLKGFEESPVRLQTNDFVFVPPRGKTVAISGSVRRPAVFELKGNEDFADLLEFAGGLLPEAYARRVQIERIIPFQERRDPSIARAVLDFDLTEVLNGTRAIDLRDGDVVRTFFISDRVDNSVTVNGAVFQPGLYQLSDSLVTVRDLIRLADGLTEKAYRGKAELVRLRDDLSERLISLDVAGILADAPTQNIPLRARDRLRIFSVDDIQSTSTVSISGRVRSPQTLPYQADMSVADLLFAGGGLRDSLFVQSVFLERADILRTSADGLTQQVIPFDLGDALNGGDGAALPLRPLDQIRVYSKTDIVSRGGVTISGQIRQPQSIPFRENMTVFDLLFEGGGLQDSLFVKDVLLGRADLIRYTEDLQQKRIIPFHLGNALQGQGYAMEELRPGDEVRVYPRSAIQLRAEDVSISGAVRSPGTFQWEDGLTLEDLILRAQGFTPFSYLSEAEVSRISYNSGASLSTTVRVPLLGDVRDETGAVSGLVAGEDTLSALFAARSFRLQPLDRVVIRTDPNYRPLETVTVLGEVNFPGEYTIERENERLSSVLRRAGGLTDTGYAKGGRIFRDSEQLIIRFDRALAGSRGHDVELLPGDRITIPRHPNTVRVSGNVIRAGLFKHVSGQRVSYYLDRAGGVAEETEAILVTQADGSTFRLRGGLFPQDPRVDEGGEVSATRKAPVDPEEKTDVGRIITDTVSVISAALTAIVLARRL